MFALVVADVSHHDALVIIKEIVVAHVGRDIELRTQFDGLVEQESAGTATQGDAVDDALAVATVAHGSDLECRLDALEHLDCRSRLDVAYHTAAGRCAALVAVGVHAVVVQKSDIGHYESEHFTKEIFLEIIQKKSPTFAVAFAKSETNQVNYL